MDTSPKITAHCLACGHEIRRGGAPFVDLRQLQCTVCGGFGTRIEPDRYQAVGRFMIWWAIVLLVVMAIVGILAIRNAPADELGKLMQDMQQQAAAVSKAEGAPAAVQCFQVRVRGNTAVCITLEQWKRMHQDDRTALPEYRVGMRL
mgnify:CR=1 FL=1